MNHTIQAFYRHTRLQINLIKSVFRTIAIITITPVLLSGCGGGGDLNTLLESFGTTSETVFEGSVGDGPIVGATITLTDADGNILTSATSDNLANYRIKLRKNFNYPVIITATGGTDIVTNAPPEFEMMSVAFDHRERTANINPFTTLMVKTAINMPGGLNQENLNNAMDKILVQLNFGLDTQIVPNPITTHVTEFNVANVIKASEAISEMIKRVSNELLITGNTISKDAVIDALSGDLTDGVIDGLGVNTDYRISALSKIIAGQVLIETMINQLHVDNVDATDRLDTAIKLTSPDATQTTADVPITQEMIDQTIVSLSAGYTLSPSSDLASMIAILNTITAGSLPVDIDTTITFSDAELLNQTITSTTFASVGELETINQEILVSDIVDTTSTNNTTTVNDTVTTDNNTNTTDPTTSTTELTITNTTPGTYSWDTLAANTQVFIDRSYTYITIPDTYLGYHVLKTANADKASVGDSYVSFDINQSTSVYVAYDIRIPALPTWLSTWTDTGDTIVDTDTTRRLYKMVYSSGTVSLGGNEGPNQSMYTVLVAPQQNTTNNGNATGGDTTSNTGNTTGDTGTTTGDTGTSNPDPVIPVAVDDNVSTQMDSAININVLANDTGLDNGPVNVSILTAPTNGTASIQSDNTITYTPDSGFVGIDSFTYKIVDTNGAMATATVSIQIICDLCATGVTITYSWNPNPEKIQGYRVYYGPALNSATSLLSDIGVSATGFDATAPSISYDAWNQLSLNKGDTICFRLKAYNSAGSSDYSQGVCNVVPN